MVSNDNGVIKAASKSSFSPAEKDGLLMMGALTVLLVGCSDDLVGCPKSQAALCELSHQAFCVILAAWRFFKCSTCSGTWMDIGMYLQDEPSRRQSG